MRTQMDSASLHLRHEATEKTVGGLVVDVTDCGVLKRSSKHDCGVRISTVAPPTN